MLPKENEYSIQVQQNGRTNCSRYPAGLVSSRYPAIYLAAIWRNNPVIP